MIRTDASIEIGSGHLSRCLNLAATLRNRGGRVIFACRESPDGLFKLPHIRNFELIAIGGGERSGKSSGWTWRVDADHTKAAIAQIGQVPDWLIVDHYDLDARWEDDVRSSTTRLMVIDDLANRAHSCDLLLDQNWVDEMEVRYDGLTPAHCEQLLGPRFALIDKKFAAARETLRSRDGDMTRLMVFFGGGDPGNVTGKAIDAIVGLDTRGLEVDVVVGGANPHAESIRSRCAELPGVHFHQQVDDMAALYANADLALGAGGVSMWERCCLGLPSLVITIATNQCASVTKMANAGNVIYLGTESEVTATTIGSALRVYMSNPWLLRSLAESSIGLVDGRGSERVARKLLPNRIRVRRAAPADRDAVFGWRNAESTRRYFFSPEPVPQAIHNKWFKETLDRKDRVLLIAESEAGPVGVLRYDLNGDEADVSIYLVPGEYGRGYGADTLEQGHIWLKAEHPEIRRVLARIVTDNIASMKTFEKAGFHEAAYIFERSLLN